MVLFRKQEDSGLSRRAVDARRRELGIPLVVLARMSGQPLPTVKRLLGSDEAWMRASLSNVLALASALGMHAVCDAEDAEVVRERRAREHAEELVAMVGATSALEGQAVDGLERARMIERTVHELLAGPARRLWGSAGVRREA